MNGFIEITAINPKIQYIASSGQTVFDYPFIAFTDDDLSVYVNGTLTTAFTATTLYPSEGGTVTLDSGATLSDVITIMRNTPVIKDTGYTTGGEFRASTIDYQYAKFIAILQQLVRDLRNAAKLSPSTTLTGGITLPEPEDGKSFKWFGVSGAIVNTDNDVDEVVNTATAQAVIATTQAGLATTAEVNAATSETNAQGYASTASTAKDDALLAQTAAESARDLAQGYAAAAADVAKIEWQGAWAAGSYNEHDAVSHNGTSYIATTTTSEEPSDTATNWDVLAAKGTDGTGTAIGSDLIASNAVTTVKIADGAVTNEKIAMATITADKLSSDISFASVKHFYASTSSVFSVSNSYIIPIDGSIPQSTEGIQFMTLDISCNIGDKIAVIFSTSGCGSAAGMGAAASMAMFLDSSVDAVAWRQGQFSTGATPTFDAILQHMFVATATSHTIKVRLGSASGQCVLYFNGNQYGSLGATSAISTFVIKE